nr:hypothetical protein [uncultured Methanomethylovorans sp.]
MRDINPTYIKSIIHPFANILAEKRGYDQFNVCGPFGIGTEINIEFSNSTKNPESPKENMKLKFNFLSNKILDVNTNQPIQMITKETLEDITNINNPQILVTAPTAKAGGLLRI